MKILAVIIALTTTFAAVVPADAEDIQLPNLVPIPPSDIRIAEADEPEEFGVPTPVKALRFSTTTFNLSDYPLDLIFGPESLEDVMTNGREILQCITFAGPMCASRASAGRALYHTPHGHWHVEDYAYYTLVPVTEDGLPDFDAEPVAPGVKASFCLMDMRRGSNAQTTDISTYNTCNNFRQGMTQHHADTYGSGLYGQQIVIDDVPAGVYGVVIRINPIFRLFETTTADNRSWAVVDLTDDPCKHGEVAVLRTGVS